MAPTSAPAGKDTATPGRASDGQSSRTDRQTTADLAFCARAMKAPALLDAAGRLAERARTESWTHLEYLVACLQREVAARDAHGREGRIRAARFPAIKTIEELDLTDAGRSPSARRGTQRDPGSTVPVRRDGRPTSASDAARLTTSLRFAGRG